MAKYVVFSQVDTGAISGPGRDESGAARRDRTEIWAQDRLQINFDLAVSATSTEITASMEGPRPEIESASRPPSNGRTFSQLARPGADTPAAWKLAGRESFVDNGARLLEGGNLGEGIGQAYGSVAARHGEEHRFSWEGRHPNCRDKAPVPAEIYRPRT